MCADFIVKPVVGHMSSLMTSLLARSRPGSSSTQRAQSMMSMGMKRGYERRTQ